MTKKVEVLPPDHIPLRSPYASKTWVGLVVAVLAYFVPGLPWEMLFEAPFTFFVDHAGALIQAVAALLAGAGIRDAVRKDIDWSRAIPFIGRFAKKLWDRIT